MDEASRLLKKLVIDDGQCVTKTTILRQTSLNMRQIDGLMNDFYEKHKDLPLNATFLVLGTKSSENGVSPIRQSVICDQDSLEQTKRKFDNVISVNIYSLHHNSSTDVQNLLNADWSGKYTKPLRPIGQRLGIVCKQAASSSKATEKPYIDNIIPQFESRSKAESADPTKSFVCRPDQRKLKDAFEIAVRNSKADAEKMEVDQEVTSPRKRPQSGKASKAPTKKTPKTATGSKTKNGNKPTTAKKSKASNKSGSSKLKQSKLNFKPL